jgi:starvation-inducible outer membrane lipoprotein
MMKALHLSTALTAPLGALCLLTACASPLAQWEAQQGDSLRAFRAAQLLDPQAAARHGDKLTAQDGKAAIETADRYVNSYREPPPQNIFVVGPAVTGGK